MLFVGDDWAEDHHDVEIEDDAGRQLARQRVSEGLAGITQLHALIAGCMPAECQWPGTGNGTRHRARSRMPAMRICWRRSSGWTGRITVQLPVDSAQAEAVKLTAWACPLLFPLLRAAERQMKRCRTARAMGQEVRA